MLEDLVHVLDHWLAVLADLHKMDMADIHMADIRMADIHMDMAVEPVEQPVLQVAEGQVRRFSSGVEAA